MTGTNKDNHPEEQVNDKFEFGKLEYHVPSEADILSKVADTAQGILDNVFDQFNPEKRKIETPVGRLNFACPYCKDSKYDHTKKRGNIYFNRSWYVCYNCFRSFPLYEFLIDFGVDHEFSHGELAKLREVENDNPKAKTQSKIIHAATDTSSMRKYLYPRALIKKLYGFLEIDRFPKITKYLFEERRISREYKNFFLYNYDRNHLVLLNCQKNGEKVVSFQERKMYNSKVRYLSTTYIDIFEKIGKDPESMNPHKRMIFELLSLYFNILNVDIRQNIFVFEGFVDSLMIPNSISMSSAKNFIDKSQLFYFYDADDTGRKESINALNNGCNVFMWKQFKKDYPTYKFNDDGYPIKDLNQVMQKQWIGADVLIKYFTNNKLDKLKL